MAGAAAAVFLNARVPQGSLGIFLVGAGVALVLCPPKARVDRWLWLAAAALVVCAGLAFLPAHWFPLPGWRKALEGLPVIPLPSSVTPVPWQTGFWLALLAATTLTGLFMLAQPIRSTALLSLSLAALLVCGAYTGLAIYSKTTGWRSPFDGGATFGFFPNRNHAATFLVTGSILAIGTLAVTLRDHRWLTSALVGVCLTTCVVGLFSYSTSRGGIVFLLIGCLLWILGLGRAHWSGPLVISCVALLLAGGTYFVVSGGEAQARLAAVFARALPLEATRPTAVPSRLDLASKAPSPAGETPFDLRVLIYEDTIPLIRAFPLTGSGLGTFAMVFPQYRNASLTEMRSVHPESDWLMLTAEAGLPALVCFLTLICLLARRLPPQKGHPYWPLRWGLVVAAAAALLHGLVDVPAHHVSLGWWILVLAGLGLQSRGGTTFQRSRWQHLVFVAGGIGMLILGVQLIRAEWFGAPPLPPFASEKAEADIVKAYDLHDFAAAARIARQSTFASPLDETFYYQWAAFELPFADTDADIDAAFQAERWLDPGSPAVPLRQGEAWLHYDSGRTVALWVDALARRQRMDRLAHAEPATSLGFYRDLLARAAKWPAVQKGLQSVVADQPTLGLVWLESARPELVRDQVERFADDADFLRRLDSKERQRFLLAWYAAGDRGALTHFVEMHGDWQEVAWPVWLRQWVDALEFERAVQEAARHYGISLALPATRSPGDPGERPAQEQEKVDPVAAFNDYWRDENTVAALRVLSDATSDENRTVPPEIWRLKAAAAAKKADWADAWRSLRQYIKVKCGEEPL